MRSPLHSDSGGIHARTGLSPLLETSSPIKSGLLSRVLYIVEPDDVEIEQSNVLDASQTQRTTTTHQNNFFNPTKVFHKVV